ncbi:MAG: 6-carboxytetrahydropterin synthase [Candidatus Hodarchaeales archaeon]
MLEESKGLGTLKLEKTSTHFSSAHLVIDPSYSEGIHGHNYFVEISVRGKIGRFGMIVNFLKLDEIVQKISKEWDHFLLLPKNNQHLNLVEKKDNLEFTVDTQYYSVPKKEVILLDCTNVTTEELSRLFSLRLYKELEDDHVKNNIDLITVTIWETPFYSASYTIDHKVL